MKTNFTLVVDQNLLNARKFMFGVNICSSSCSCCSCCLFTYCFRGLCNLLCHRKLAAPQRTCLEISLSKIFAQMLSANTYRKRERGESGRHRNGQTDSETNSQNCWHSQAFVCLGFSLHLSLFQWLVYPSGLLICSVSLPFPFIKSA